MKEIWAQRIRNNRSARSPTRVVCKDRWLGGGTKLAVTWYKVLNVG